MYFIIVTKLEYESVEHYEKITQYDLDHPDDLYGFFGVPDNSERGT